MGQSNQSRASSAEGRAEFEALREGERERERESGRASANFAALEDVEARSLVEAYGFKVRIEASGDVAARLERERASIPVSEPVHAGKRTDKTGMRAGLDRISAYRHVPRSTSRVTLPTRTTPRRSVRPVGDPGTRRCDADQDPCVRPSRSMPSLLPTALCRDARVPFYQIVLRFALLIQLEQTPDSFTLARMEPKRIVCAHRFHPLFLGLPLPPPAY